LRVEGAVARPIELDFDSMEAMWSTTSPPSSKCAGNGRVYYVPPKEGLQWQNGAVGNAAWTGVLLREILEMADVRGTALEVLLKGADSGIVDANKKTASPGPIAFARRLPLEKTIAGSTILAYSMNDHRPHVRVASPSTQLRRPRRVRLRSAPLEGGRARKVPAMR
jgi:DMSO/TMAO reductase YedYZ molybdopterin-dependent catalytic subunit